MDDLRTVAELARLDAPPACARHFTLITAPASISNAQSDCDCACPASPSPLRPTHVRPASTRLRLHPQATFATLTDQEHLLFVPSVVSGVVVNGALKAALGATQPPATAAELAATLSPDLVERLIALDIFIDDAAEPPLAASETLVAWLHVTNACNLRCTYCYLNKTDEAMTAETGRAAVDGIVRSALRHGYQAIKLKFAGGEASLNLPLVWELHDYAREVAAASGLALDAVVLSNGVGMGRASMLELLRRGIRLMISLDGFAADHDAQRIFANGRGSFAAVSRTIDRALALGLRPDISVTVSGRTAGGLAVLLGWLLERDLSFSLNFYRENDCSAGFAELRLDEERIIAGMLAAFDVIEERLPERSLLGSLIDRANLATPHSKPCGVGESYMVIDQHGGVAKCQMEIERPIGSVRAADPLGLVRADTIGVRNVPVEQKQGCRDCTWRHWCAGGCPIATFRATGRYDVRSPNCGIYTALYPAAMRLEGLRLLKYGDREDFNLS